ncbi:MAG: DUF3782 domain-containing protein [Chloroflexota bacterium]
MTKQTNEEAIAEIWQLFKETDARFKETDERLDKRIQETDTRLDKRIQETDTRLDKRIQETDARLDKRIRQLEGLFGNQWGRLVESLVEPGVLKLFQNRGISVHNLYRRALAQQNGHHMEVDLLLENETEAIAVEVKSSFSIEDVSDFLEEMAQFFHYFSRYQGYKLYGAVAGLDIGSDVTKYAYRRGLFVISITGNNLVQILNDEMFQPRDFGNSD